MINSNCITDTDLVHISREDNDYKTTFEQLQYDVTDFGHLPKLPFDDGDGPMPWDDIPDGCGRFHIKNMTDRVYLDNIQGIGRLYTMRGRRVPIEPLTYLDVGEWILVASGNSTFKNSTGNWEFGALTDTTKLTAARSMFSYCTDFDQDLSGWCVPLIKDEDQYKDMFNECPNMENSPEKHPVWGTCPGGNS